MDRSEYRIYLEEWDYGNYEGMVLFRQNEDGTTDRAKIEWIPHSDSHEIGRNEETLRLSAPRGVRRPISAILIRALQECGELRRAQITDTADLRGWLDDMRKLVFRETTNDR